MKTMDEPPLPENSGSEDTQGMDGEILDPQVTQTSVPINSTSEALATANTRSLGGELAASLLQGTLSERNSTIATLQGNLKETQSDLAFTSTELALAKQSNKENVVQGILANSMRVIGALVFGFGVTTTTDGTFNVELPFVVLGSVLLVLGLFAPLLGKKKN